MTIGSPLIGAKLGPYELQALLGRGGMSTVYQGFDTNLQRPIAIKVLADFIAEQPHFTARFRQEALLLARLRHRHIVQVYDFDDCLRVGSAGKGFARRLIAPMPHPR